MKRETSISRRSFLKAAAACGALAALAGCGGGASSSASTGAGNGSGAQGTTYKVGVVNYVDDASLNQIISNLESRLDEQGTALGITFNYADYYDNAQADAAVLNQIAADLIADKVDIIVAVATPTAAVMKGAAEEAGIPVVFAAASDPVGSGLVADMNAPGCNVTGTSDGLDANALINLMLALDPALAKVGILYDTAQSGSLSAVADARAILSGKGIEVVEKTGGNTDEVVLAAEALIAEGVGAVFTPTDNTIMAAEQAIAGRFIEAGIPHYTGADSFALWGAFCGYGVNYATLGRATADLVVDILVNGADPAATPVVTFDNGNVSVNVETCAALGYDVDEVRAAFEPIATEFIELTTQQEFDP